MSDKKTIEQHVQDSAEAGTPIEPWAIAALKAKNHFAEGKELTRAELDAHVDEVKNITIGHPDPRDVKAAEQETKSPRQKRKLFR
jgi:hypothetical protein